MRAESWETQHSVNTCAVEISKIYKYHYADTTQEQQGSPPQQQLKQTDADWQEHKKL